MTRRTVTRRILDGLGADPRPGMAASEPNCSLASFASPILWSWAGGYKPFSEMTTSDVHASGYKRKKEE